MGRFDKLVGSIGGNSARPCPDCRKFLRADSDIEGRYECTNDSCPGSRVYFEEGGVLVDPGNRGTSDVFSTCQWCQESLSGADGSLPWADGSNPHAYIICPSCKQENIYYGFGEDD